MIYLKKTVLQSTVILVIVSVIAKALSFIVRIMLARTLSPSAMNYYTLAAPTMVFFITLAQMGIPGALSKVIAQSDHPHQPLKVSVILSLSGYPHPQAEGNSARPVCHYTADSTGIAVRYPEGISVRSAASRAGNLLPAV